MIRLPRLGMMPFRPLTAPPRLFLGQAAIPFKVVLVDTHGTAIEGAHVRLEDGQETTTDDAGVATFERAPRGQVNVEITVDGLKILKRGDTSESLLVGLPICTKPKFLTNTEIIALGAGAALAGAGIYWKADALQVVGEVLFGAGAFTAIYRHSCAW